MKKRMICFRMYPDVTRNSKIRALNFEGRWLWICLLSIACENNGMIEKDIDDIAYISDLNIDFVEKSISDMLNLKLLDEADNCYTPHNWRERQLISDNHTNYMRQWRARKKQTANDESEPRTKDENSMKNNENSVKNDAEDNEKTASENRPITPPSFPPSFPPLNPPY